MLRSALFSLLLSCLYFSPPNSTLASKSIIYSHINCGEDSSFFLIKGRVVEIKNLNGDYQTIKDVKVSISNTNLQAQTDKHGNYELRVPKEFLGKDLEIKVEKVNYNSKPFLVSHTSFRKSTSIKVTNIMWSEKADQKQKSRSNVSKNGDCPKDTMVAQKKKPSKKNKRYGR
jgi:hypothetical protein